MSRILRLSLFMLLLSLPLLPGCKTTSKVKVPSIADNAAEIHYPGRFVWFDLYSTDMTTVSNFYDALFGWDFVRTDDFEPRIKNIILRGRVIGNLFGRDSEPGDSWWLCSMSVRNVDASAGVVMEAGGTVSQPPQPMPNRGRTAVAVDPQGATLSLLTTYTGDPDIAPQVNRWVGCELWTRDVNAALDFYRPLAGYDGVHQDKADPEGHVQVTIDGTPSGGIVKIGKQPLKPQWIPYVGVASALQTVIKAQSLGGEVLVAPDPKVLQGRVAILRDPSGAVFGIQELR